MTNELIKKNYKDIADAIRSKTGENGTMTAEDMPAKIESIETGIEPSGSLDITTNGNNIDVTTKATVNVNVPIPPAKISSDQATGFSFIRELEKDGRGADGVYAIIGYYDDELDGSIYVPWEEYHELDLHPFSGGYDENELNPWTNDPGFVVAGIYPDTFDENHSFSINIQAVYTQYSGSYTEEELELAWQEKFYQYPVPVFDLTGRRIGILDTVSGCHVEFRADS